MTIHLHWWLLPIILFVLPIIGIMVEPPYKMFAADRKSNLRIFIEGTISFLMWGASIGIIIGHFL